MASLPFVFSAHSFRNGVSGQGLLRGNNAVSGQGLLRGSYAVGLLDVVCRLPPSFGSRGSGGGWWLRAWVGLVRAGSWVLGPWVLRAGLGWGGFVRVPSGPSVVLSSVHQSIIKLKN